MSKTIFQYQIEDRVFFVDPVVAYRALWAACPELGKICDKLNAALAKLKVCETDPSIPAYEKLEADEDVEDAENLLVEAFRKAFGHPWVASIAADKADTVCNAGHDTCIRTLTDFFVWTDELKKNTGGNRQLDPSMAAPTS